MNPKDPVTPMQEVSVQTREIFVSLVAAGFSEYQASVIVGTMMAQLMMNSEKE